VGEGTPSPEIRKGSNSKRGLSEVRGLPGQQSVITVPEGVQRDMIKKKRRKKKAALHLSSKKKKVKMTVGGRRDDSGGSSMRLCGKASGRQGPGERGRKPDALPSKWLEVLKSRKRRREPGNIEGSRGGDAARGKK